MADELVEAMNRKAKAGFYDDKHPVEALRERAEGGDTNAQSALLMRTGEYVEELEAEPPTTEEIDNLCST